MIKKISKLFLLILALFMAVPTTKAESAPKNLTIVNHTIASEPIVFPDKALNSTVNFHVKKTTEGKYVYCMQYAKKPPVNSITYTNTSLIKDKGVNYILNGGSNAVNDYDFFLYQTALWVYLVETNQMEGSHGDIDRFIKTLNGNTDKLSKEIRKIANDAKIVPEYDNSNPSISVNDSNITFTLVDGYYVSSNIYVNSSTGEYDVYMKSAPNGTIDQEAGNYFTIKVPESSVTETVNLSFEVVNSKTIYKTYLYTPSDSKYQTMASTYKDLLTSSDMGKATIVKEKAPEPEPIITKIFKVDSETGKTVIGAKLQLTNSNGKIIDTWMSADFAKEFKNLAEGTYSLTELEAPNGYEKSKESVIFKIDSKGNLLDSNGNKISEVKFANKKVVIEEPKKVPTGVKISKQDITNKKELAGATLVVKDYNGNTIKTWVSTTEPTYIELKPGIYTLTETIAPEGYVLSSETITFTVKEDGTIDTVVMYNTPNAKEVVVENTASFKKLASTFVGLIVSVLGIGFIFKKPKNLI